MTQRIHACSIADGRRVELMLQYCELIYIEMW